MLVFAAMKKARIGILGCGSMSRWHGKVWTTEVPEAEIVALCDTHQPNLERYQRELFEPLNQTPATFADYRDMLAKVKLDGVMIITPHAHHFEQATAALDAGCHVLVEKPMVVTVEDARKLIAHALKTKRVLSVGLQGTFSPEFAYIRKQLEGKQLGEVRCVDAYVTQRWLAATRDTWRQDPKLSGGGEAYDSGAHVLHAMLYLPNLRPTEVFAWMNDCGTPVDIITAATIRYENGALGSVAINGNDVRGWEEGIYISASQGSVRTSVHGGRLEHWDATGKPVRYPAVKPVPSMYQNFVDCILGRAQTPCPPIWGLRHALLMEALYESARTGKPAKVLPE